jgi:hypothetical protein
LVNLDDEIEESPTPAADCRRVQNDQISQIGEARQVRAVRQIRPAPPDTTRA